MAYSKTTKMKPAIIQKLSSTLPYSKILFTLFSVNLVLLLFLLLIKYRLPPEIPLLYGQPQSERVIVNVNLIFLPTAISLIIIFLNSLFMKFSQDNFLEKTFLGAIVASSILSLLATLKIVLLVGNF